MEAYEKYDNGDLLNGRYAKVADISEGSYGLVSLAQDTKRNNAYVAVKFIYPADYPRKKLLRQISSATGRATSSPAKLRSNVEDLDSRQHSVITALLEESSKEIAFHKVLGHHPNIPDLIDSFGSCLVLEYCSRGDLYEAMQSDTGPTTSQDIKDVFSQILSALTYCYSKLVFHRDLKPENILISKDWTIKICDWGLATTQRIVTNRSEFDIGSERYMAPELFDQDLTSYDASKVDLWSVGVILLTLVFHKNPFQVANYTDKRFLQFSANREALFDFFSTMTSELFGALRFCLNMDPSNRDLEGLKRELENVKYFTIDEEYWAAHSDEDEEEDDCVGYEEDLEYEAECTTAKDANDEHDDNEEFNFEDEMFSFDKEPVDSAEKQLSVIQDVSDLSEENIPSIIVNRNISSALDDATDSDATNNTYAPTLDHSEMPYNRRADALLSPFTHMKPIPITSNAQIRNTRKPFGLASYNKSGAFALSKNWIHGSQQPSGSYGGKFRREDFFTPRGTFMNYMDRYGEQREQKDFNRGNDKKKKWNRGRKRQSWKKRPQKSPQHGTSTEMNGKRRYSNTHKRKSVRPNTQNTIQVLQSPTSSVSRNGGKYVPPFMRTKSPSLVGLTENLENLHLNDDEVFHLDDDYSGHLSSRTLKHGSLHTIINQSNLHLGYHQAPNQADPAAHSFAAHDESMRSSTSQRHFNSDHESKQQPNFTQSHVGEHSVPVFGNGAESQMSSQLRSLAGRGDFSGKYVPPFRRGSCSAAGGKQEKKRPLQLGGVFPSIQHALLDNETSRSVPRESWLAKKE